MRTLLLAVLVSVTASAAAAQTSVTEQVKQAQKLVDEGNLTEAVSLLKSAVAAAPDSFDAHLSLGRVLDLQGDHRAAREHLERAIKLSSDDTRNEALTTMGISLAFESKAADAARYYQRAFDAQTQADDRAAAAATANALGRIYLESGDLAKAEQWYRTGYETSKRIPEQDAARQALWELRWQHALARIAARKGEREAAMKHAAQVKTLLDQGGNENQRPVYPYLLGYIALHTKQYDQAVKELSQSDPEDPFVLGLAAEAHERAGDSAKAREHYERVLTINEHNINNAFARPKAKRFLARSKR